ncbi:hypothetical protein HK102_004751 [Quaeritorhiza haematococci]|nr:hypothetical protein HK102_004751 [Quaeritorhiza haematococci]
MKSILFKVLPAALCLSATATLGFPSNGANSITNRGKPTGLSELPCKFKNDMGPFQLSWGYPKSGNGDEIEVEFNLPSLVYVGFGFGETSTQADMVVGYVDEEGNGHVHDMFDVHGQSPPSMDTDLPNGADNLLYRAAWIENKPFPSTTVRFRRKINTGDKWDASFTPGRTQPIAYAWCDEDCVEAAMHHGEMIHHGRNNWNIVDIDFKVDGCRI